MSRRHAAWLAWSLCLSVLALIIGAVWLAALNRADLWQLSFLTSVALAALVGGVIGSYRSANLVGWLILGHALCLGLGEFARQFTIYGLIVNPGALPLAGVLSSLPYWIWFPGVFLLIVFLPLYFPDGRLVSPRWRPVVLFAMVACAMVTGFAAFLPSTGAPSGWEIPGVPNPLGVDALQRFERFGIVVPVLWLGLGLAAAMSLVVRYRRSGGEEQQQIKWVAYAVGLLIAYSLVNNLLLFPLGLASTALRVLSDLVLGYLWIAIAIAILKYRLYDIDLLINRTLVYGTLTALLALLYVAGVATSQSIFRMLTGQGEQLAVVASTLTIAALFTPLRRRIQTYIDRRFYRHRYDAQKTVQAFSGRLRSATDLGLLSDDLVQVVHETFQPAHISLWLREGTLQSGEHP